MFLYTLTILLAACTTSRDSVSNSPQHYHVRLRLAGGEDQGWLQVLPHGNFEITTLPSGFRDYSFDLYGQGAMEQFKDQVREHGAAIAQLDIGEERP